MELMRQALRESPPTAEDRLDPEEEFLSTLGRRIAEWFNANKTVFEEELPPPCLFVLAEDGPFLETSDWPEEKKHRSLAAPDCLSEGSVFVCDLQCEYSYVVDRKIKTTGDAVDFVKEKGLGDRVFAVLLTAQNRLLVHLPDRPPEKHIQYRIEPYNTEHVTLGDIEDEMSELHKNGTSTHLGDCYVWESAKDGKMVKEAERAIQGHVASGLRIRFRSRAFLLDKEVWTYKGREDIRILWRSPDNDEHKDIGLVIELKVLRPTNSENKNINWVKEGIKQAVDYAKTDDQIRTKWVACYDARDKPKPYPDTVKTLAEKHDVEIKQYLMQRSAH